MSANGRGYEQCGIAWLQTYPPLLTLTAGTELANYSETRIAYEPLLAFRALFIIFFLN
jgi:hypothetical protein